MSKLYKIGHDRICREQDATHHFDVHSVAGPQRERVLDAGAVDLLVLGHAGRVLREALRVDESVELLAEGGQRDGDVLGVARHPHILNDV